MAHALGWRSKRREEMRAALAPTPPVDPFYAPAVRRVRAPVPTAAPRDGAARLAVEWTAQLWPQADPDRAAVLRTLVEYLLNEDPRPPPALRRALSRGVAVEHVPGRTTAAALESPWEHAERAAALIPLVADDTVGGPPPIPALWRRPRPTPYADVRETLPTLRARLGAGWDRFGAPGTRTDVPVPGAWRPLHEADAGCAETENE